MILIVKHMVTTSSKVVVKSILDSQNLPYRLIEIGHIEMMEEISNTQKSKLKEALKECGMELIEDRQNALIGKIKDVVANLVYNIEEPPRVKNSCYISDMLQYDYTYLANLFSHITGMTIEQYIIAHRIERAKAMLLYDDCSLTNIAYKLNYSSVAHLSAQFKKVTGFTPTYFKQLMIKDEMQIGYMGLSQAC